MFETLKLNDDFEINSQPPHEIRNKETKEILKVRISDYGHEIVDLPSKIILSSMNNDELNNDDSMYDKFNESMNSVHNKIITYALARIIANQWIPNPNNFIHISFIDKNRSHTFVSNIVWSKESQPWDELTTPTHHFIRYNPTTDSMEIKHNNSIILPSITPDNLLYFRSMNNHKIFIHELVAQHYLSNLDNFQFIIHSDNNTLNNKPTNLYYSKYDIIPNQQEIQSQPKNIRQLKKYDGDKFDNLYISINSQQAFVKVDDKYFELQTHSSKLGKYIQSLTITNRKRRLYFSTIESLFTKSFKSNTSFKQRKRYITNQNHIIDYFDTLPENVIQIKSFNHQPLKPIYFYDPINDSIIKQFKSKYRIIRSMTFLIEFNDGTKSNISRKDLISSLTNQDNSSQPTMIQQNDPTNGEKEVDINNE